MGPKTRLAVIVASTLLLAACRDTGDGAVHDALPSQRIIELSTDGMGFAPDPVEVRVGETVRFIFRNADAIPHEAYIGTEEQQLEHRSQHAAAAARDQADVPHGGAGAYVHARGTEQFTYRFSRAGQVIIGCHLPGHWEAGMRAFVMVSGS